MPASFKPTLTGEHYAQAIFQKSVDSCDTENVASVRAGLRDGDLWDAYVNVSYVDETCTDNTCDRSGTDNTFRKTDDYTVVDLSGSYALNPSARVYAKVDNVLDDQEIVSRSPHGARPNLPRTAYLGIRVDF